MNRLKALFALVALPGIARIYKASLMPTDVIVVECDEHLSYKTKENMTETLLRIWPDNKIVVLDGHVKIRVLEQGQS